MTGVEIAILGGAATGAIGQIAGAIGSSQQSKEQAKISKDVLEWQKQAQAEAWRREDNAVQRRVEDLRAAGLSPTLAAGSSAASSGPITPTIPQAARNQGQTLGEGLSGFNKALSEYVQLSNIENNIAQTKAATEGVNIQNNLNRENVQIAKQNVKKAKAETNLMRAKAAIENKDWERYRLKGVRPNDTLSGSVTSGGDFLESMLKNLAK